MSITRIRTFKVEGQADFSGLQVEERQVGQLDVYPEFASHGPRTRAPGPQAIAATYVQVDCDEGASGLFGPLSETQVPAIRALAPYLIQADPDWTGGLTELVKICALASAYGRQVIPHGHSVWAAVHLIASQSPAVCPMAEFLVRHQPVPQYFHRTFLHPEGGQIPLPTAPGLGIELDEGKIERVVELG